MFLSVKRCAEPMTQLCRLKVKVTLLGNAVYPSICVSSISPKPLEGFSLKFTQIFLLVRRCAELITQLPRLKVKVTDQGLEFCVHFISPEPFRRFSLDVTQMFLLVRQCAEPMTQLRRLKVKITLQGHVIYLSICVRSISPKPFERFSLKFTQMFL